MHTDRFGNPEQSEAQRAQRFALHEAALAMQARTGRTYLECVAALEADETLDGDIPVVTLRACGSEQAVFLRAPSTAAPPTGFKGVAYSGGAVRAPSGMMAIDLAGLQLKAEVPVLRNHDAGQIVGRARLSCDGTALHVVEGAFSDVTPHGREVRALMAENHPWDLSVGMSGTHELCDGRKSIRLNGRTMHVDFVLRKARLLEVSFVPAGADPNAQASSL